MIFTLILSRSRLRHALAAAAFLCSAPAIAACEGRLAAGAAIHAGPVCVPAEPQRIVALDPTFSLTMALELGLPVAGAPLFAVRDEALLALAEASGVQDIGTASEPSIERIAALQPDLILGDAAMHAAAYGLASQFAPTLLIDAQDWQTFFRTIAGATGKAARAEAALAGYEERAAAIRSRMPDVSVSVLRITPFGFQVYADGPAAYAPFAVLRDAGVRRTPYETVDDATILKRPDWEALSQLSGDVLLYMVGNPYDDLSATSLEADTLGNPLWKTIPAVAAGRVHKVDVTTWMGFGGLRSAEKILDDVERIIIGEP